MRFLQIGGVIVVASILSTLGIMASDALQSNSGLLAQLVATDEGAGCPTGMVPVPTATSFSCVDRYEVSPGETCQHQRVTSPVMTLENIQSRDCAPVSRGATEPWTYVTREQAAQLCARGGKRLPTAVEWYQLAIDTPDDPAVCNLNSRGVDTRADSLCVSAYGVVHAVGNVWEWVSDDVINGQLDNRPLPSEGYVAQVDQGGVPTVSTSTPQTLFAADYVWVNAEGVYGVLRGGYFGSQSDGGLYALHAETAPTAATVATGFRCVQ